MKRVGSPKNVYFTAVQETAVWGAELAKSLAGLENPGRIYIVEPTGTFADDPNVTNKRFPGNPTRSYRIRQPLRVVGEGMVGWVIGLDPIPRTGTVFDSGGMSEATWLQF